MAEGRQAASRRRLLRGAGGLGLAAAGLALPGCSGVSLTPGKTPDPADDAAIAANLLGLERAAASAYAAALEAGILGNAERDMAAAFAADHQRHAEWLARVIERLHGSTPQAAAGRPPPPALATREEALRWLAGIEQGLSLAHLGAVPALAGKDIAKGTAGILGVEAMHWAVWRRGLGEPPVPTPIIG